MSREGGDAYQDLSPFELKDRLIELATECTRRQARLLLDAGRANPDWIALEAREAFFELGRFALEESRAAAIEEGLGGHPAAPGAARRLRAAFGTGPLRDAFDLAQARMGFDPDAFAHELVLGVLGADYPAPVRMLRHAERIVQAYLGQELYRGAPPPGRLELFATEGATAGICYVFRALLANRLLHRGDRVAIGVPAFSPYLEIPRLDEFGFETVPLAADEVAGWQYPDAEIDRLADPTVRALVVINPGNPTAVAMHAGTLERIAELVRGRRPDLLIVTDDVYAGFAEGYRSLAALAPANTIVVYSFSKYFACTGWRLGVVGVHEDNALDRLLARLPAREQKALEARYASVTVEPSALRFIDRAAADSRAVALNHTAGLSAPQQVQMTLFALHALSERGADYRGRARTLLHARRAALLGALGIALPEDDLQTDYYATLDLLDLARRLHGEAFAARLRRARHPLDLVFELAREYATVVLPGEGFEAPGWSVRISLANLPEAAYREIGTSLRTLLAQHYAAL